MSVGHLYQQVCVEHLMVMALKMSVPLIEGDPELSKSAEGRDAAPPPVILEQAFAGLLRLPLLAAWLHAWLGDGFVRGPPGI